MKEKGIESWKILVKAIKNFGANNPVGMAGTTAYFAIFSIAPIIIIIIAVFGFFTNDVALRAKLFNELNNLVGEKSSQLLMSAIENYDLAEKSGIGAIIGVVVFLISATTLFGIMQNYINYIWRVRVKSELKLNILKFFRDRLFSFGMILSLGLVVIISLVIDASMSLLHDVISTYFTDDLLFVIGVLKTILLLAIITSGFALIFRFLPDVSVKWSSSWFAAIFTALFFFVGKYLISIFIGKSQLGLIYGAAGSIVIILLWIYYVALIFYFGVELSYQYSKFYDHKNKPLNFAEPFEITSVTNNPR